MNLLGESTARIVDRIKATFQPASDALAGRLYMTSVLNGIGPEDRDAGNSWYEPVALRADGSPDLNQIQNAFRGAADKAGDGCWSVTAHWGGHMIATWWSGGRLSIYPLSEIAIARGLKRIAEGQA